MNSYDHRISSEEALPELLNKLDEMMEQKLGVDFAKYCRLKEQNLLLGYSKRKRYSPELIVLASSIFHCSPAAYNFLRETFFLTLPNVDYIRKLGSSNDIDSPGITDDHVSYLKQRLSGLSEDKKLVNVMLDEIHVKIRLQYKGGKIKGSSDNTPGLASSIQTFIISSLLSSYKDIVALYPVRCLTGQNLLQYTQNVLKVLHQIGFRVLSLISDNNRVNRNMFETMCGGKLKHFIPNPFDNRLKLFFLFDSVHLLKCIRNNWFNEESQKFLIPSFECFNSPLSAELRIVKDLYLSEIKNTVKLAPYLSHKTLFPSSFERQNVNLV